VEARRIKESVVKAIDILAAVLVIVGALNWGLVGVAHFNLVTALLGQTVLASIVFALVGVAGLYLIVRRAAAAKKAPAFA
jgi:uncharacterized membrane protein YuzA (DUF378 family)